MIKYRSIKQMLQYLGGRKKMSQMEQINQAKGTVIEALKNYQVVLQETFQEELKGIRDHLHRLLKESIEEDYKLCFEEKFMENYTVVSRESVEAFLRETDMWHASKAVEDYLNRDRTNWNKIFRRHIEAITLLEKVSKEYQKSQSVLKSFDESQNKG